MRQNPAMTTLPTPPHHGSFTPPRLAEPRARRRAGARLQTLRFMVPKRPSGVSRYRIFTVLVFAGIVVLDEWADRSLSAHLSGDVVGPASVLVWALTLLGALGLGPLARLRDALSR